MRRFTKRNLTCAGCGRGFNEHCMDHLCPECFEIAGIDNMINDSGGSEWNASVAVQLGHYLAAIAKKGGNVEQAKSGNDFIDWSLVPTITGRVKAAGNTKATNGVKAPVTVQYGDSDRLAYKSLFVAFNALGLPQKKMQKFRVALKTAGKLTFTHHGVEFHFTAAGF